MMTRKELGELLDLVLGDNDVIAAASAAHKRRMAAAAAAIFPQEGGQGPVGKKHKVKEFSWAAYGKVAGSPPTPLLPKASSCASRANWKT